MAVTASDRVGPPGSAMAMPSSLDDVSADADPAVEARIAADLGVDPARAAQLSVELRRWLWLCAEADRSRTVGAPSPLVMLSSQRLLDGAWHTFLLFTRRYQAFCDRHFGAFVHHEPAPPVDAGPTPESLHRLFAHVAARLGPAMLADWYVRDALLAGIADDPPAARAADALTAMDFDGDCERVVVIDELIRGRRAGASRLVGAVLVGAHDPAAVLATAISGARPDTVGTRGGLG